MVSATVAFVDAAPAETDGVRTPLGLSVEELHRLGCRAGDRVRVQVVGGTRRVWINDEERSHLLTD